MIGDRGRRLTIDLDPFCGPPAKVESCCPDTPTTEVPVKTFVDLTLGVIVATS